MKNFIWFNGKLCEEDEVKVNISDYGFLYGDGLFETMRVYSGCVFRLKEHLERLSYFIDFLKFPYTLNAKRLEKATYALLKINRLKNAYVRLNIWRAQGRRGLVPQSCNKVNIAIIAKKLNFSKEVFKREVNPVRNQRFSNGVNPVRKKDSYGVKAIILKGRLAEQSYISGIKSFNYLNNLLAKFEIESRSADEGIFLNHNEFIAEATTSNIFFVKDKKLYTPSLNCGILPGITRKTVLEIAKDNNIDVVEGKFKVSILNSLQEVFLTNSIIEIMPVTRIDDLFKTKQIPGELTKKISICYTNLIAQIHQNCNSYCKPHPDPRPPNPEP